MYMQTEIVSKAFQEQFLKGKFPQQQCGLGEQKAILQAHQ